MMIGFELDLCSLWLDVVNKVFCEYLEVIDLFLCGVWLGMEYCEIFS